MRFLVILLLCVFGFTIIFAEETSNTAATSPISNEAKASPATPIDYQVECEKRFKIKALEGRVQEMENKLTKCASKDQRIQQLNKENDDLKKTLDSEKSVLEEKQKEEQIQKGALEELTLKNAALQNEIDFYRGNLVPVLFYKIKTAIFETYSFYIDLIDSHFSQPLKHIYNHISKGTLIGLLGDEVRKTSINVYTVTHMVAETFRSSILTPIWLLVLEHSGLPSSSTISDLASHLLEASAQKYSQLKSEFDNWFSQFRVKSIKVLKINASVAHVAEEIFDLTTASGLFFIFTVVINPLMSIVLLITRFFVDAMLHIMIFAPLWFFNKFVYVATLGNGSLIKKKSAKVLSSSANSTKLKRA